MAVRLKKIVPGAHATDVIDLWTRAELVELVVVQAKTKEGAEITFFYTKSGDLVAVTDPRRETDYHK